MKLAAVLAICVALYTLIYYQADDNIKCGLELGIGIHNRTCLEIHPLQDKCKQYAKKFDSRGWDFLKTTTGSCYCMFSTPDKGYDGIVKFKDCRE